MWVVLDNLNVHTPASLYVAFSPAEARRIAKRVEFHYTAKHGSWLNVAECELAVLANQCLARRLGHIDTARREIAAWERHPNAERPTVTGHFTVTQARRKSSSPIQTRHDHVGRPLDFASMSTATLSNHPAKVAAHHKLPCLPAVIEALAAVLAVAVAVVDYVTAFTANPTSDWLWGFEVGDTFRKYGSLYGQDLPIAPYFLPDLSVLFGLRGLTGDVTLATLLYFLLFSSVFAWTVSLLMQSANVSGLASARGSLLFMLMLWFLPVFGIERIDQSGRQHYYPTFLKNFPDSHITAALIALIATAVYLRFRRTHVSWVAFSALAVIAFAIFESNSILFLYLSCPLLTIVLVDVVRGNLNIRSTLMYAALLLVPPVVTFTMRSAIDARLGVTLTFSQTMLSTPWSVEILLAGAGGFGQALVLASRGQPLLYGALAACQTVLFAAFIDAVHRARSHRVPGDDLVRLYGFLLVGQLFAILAGVAVNRLFHPDLLRYIVPSYIYPLIAAAVVVYRSAAKVFVNRWAFVAVLTLPTANLAALGPSGMDRLLSFQLADPYPAWVRCVDQTAVDYHLSAGLMPYWDIRQIRMLTHANLSGSLVNANLKFFPLADNVHSLFANNGRPREYDFVLANGLNGGLPLEAVTSEVGPPSLVVQCPDYQLLGADVTQPGPSVLVYAGADRDSLNALMRERLEELAVTNSAVRQLWRR